MKKFLLAWSIVTIVNPVFGVECKLVQEKEFNEIRDEIVMEGKGGYEVNSIMKARMDICYGKCERSSTSLCIAVKKK